MHVYHSKLLLVIVKLRSPYIVLRHRVWPPGRIGWSCFRGVWGGLALKLPVSHSSAAGREISIAAAAAVDRRLLIAVDRRLLIAVDRRLLIASRVIQLVAMQTVWLRSIAIAIAAEC